MYLVENMETKMMNKEQLKDKETEQKQKTLKWMEDITILKSRCKVCDKLGMCEKMFWAGFPIVFSDGSTTEGSKEYFYFCLDKAEEEEKEKSEETEKIKESKKEKPKTSQCFEKYQTETKRIGEPRN